MTRDVMALIILHSQCTDVESSVLVHMYAFQALT